MQVNALMLASLAAGLLGVGAVQQAGEPMRGLSRVPAPVGPEGKSEELYTGSYALLVGVSRYDVPSAWAALDSIPDELKELAAALRAAGFDGVEQLSNPTGIELRRGVEDFVGRYGYVPGHRLIFYFAGHGYSLDKGARGYFVPRDAPDPIQNESGFRRVALSMQLVTTWARDLTARHALFAFDSCFSGTIFRTRDRPVPQRISELTAKPVREFMSAGDAGQPVPARSVFTPMFIRGIKGAADLDQDGYVTGTELGNYVQREVIAYQTRQTPQFGKIRDPELDEGDLVFAVAKSGVAALRAPATTAIPPTAVVADRRPAPIPATPGSRLTTISFAGEAGMLIFQVKPAETAAFERLATRVGEIPRTAPDKTLRAQAEGIHLYRSTEPAGAAGNALYVALIDPVAPDGEYEFMRLIAQAMTPRDAAATATRDLFNQYVASFAAGANKLTLTAVRPVAQPSARVESAPDLTVPRRMAFSAPAGLLLLPVKANQVPVFEELVSALHRRLVASSSEMLRQQWAGLKVYRAAEPWPPQDVLYAIVIDPVVRDADYDLFIMLFNSMPRTEQTAPSTTAMLNRFAAAFASGINKVNLIPLNRP